MPVGTVSRYNRGTLIGRIIDGDGVQYVFSKAAGDIDADEAAELEVEDIVNFDPYTGPRNQRRARNVRRARRRTLQAASRSIASAGIASISSYRPGLGGMLTIEGSGQKVRFSDRVVSPVGAKLTKGDKVEYALYSQPRRGVWARRIKLR